jgi:hypothetical protein
MLTVQGSHLLKLFLWTVISEDFANLAVLSLGVGVLLLESSVSQVLSHAGGEATHQIDQKSVPMQSFWPN